MWTSLGATSILTSLADGARGARGCCSFSAAGAGACVPRSPFLRSSPELEPARSCACSPARSFHEIEPQSSVMELLRPSQLSRKVLAPPRGAIPASELAANTLVLSGGAPPAAAPPRAAVVLPPSSCTDLLPSLQPLGCSRWGSPDPRHPCTPLHTDFKTCRGLHHTPVAQHRGQLCTLATRRL